MKFQDPHRTAKGERRAAVPLFGLRTLWANTGTLCNITCAHCYIESSPRNDRLAYLTLDDLRAALDAAKGEPLEEVGFTGGEPFLNRELVPMLRLVLGRGLRAIVLTNAMKPMRNHAEALLSLRGEAGLTMRVSLDHPDPDLHDAERGAGSFAATLEGLRWLAVHGFRLHVAGRAGFTAEPEAALRQRFAALFEANGIPVDAADPVSLMLFPEMDETAEVPEITEACWGILGKSPESVMCASSRMLVRRRGAKAASWVACTLLPYDERFDLGADFRTASRAVALNHPHCAKFCVLGGAACSR
ncbi:radical SAM protein [Sabulicella glaciei]|uniref:Radical SAM protein n=1 Tax=Sabulicella glaciei TaxID=2984948 RepID=A0ABT3NTD3_9PROT|nr:radical SAM protein [Roseococcus sp. MDT2-1-1]